MTAMSPETKETTLFSTLVMVFICGIIIAAFGIVFVIKGREPVEDNTLCPPPAGTQCEVGIAYPTTTNVNVCEYWARPPTTACTSACHVDDTDTRCDKYGACVSTNATACLGYCALEEGELVVRDHADCDDKLTFKSYFVPGSSSSALFGYGHLFFSNYSSICHFDGGCHWFGTFLRLYQTASAADYFAPQSVIECPYFLNMTNDECIQVTEIRLDDALSIKLLVPFAAVPIVPQGVGCLYSYKCGTRNETKLDDAAPLVKRQVADPASTVAAVYRAEFLAKLPQLRRAIDEKVRVR